MSKKYTYEFVKNYFEEQGCELLSKEYINNKLPLDYICSCGNPSKIRFDMFKQGARCLKCSGKRRHPYIFVYNYFKESGCELLSRKYNNNHEPLDFICSCGNISKISFLSLQQGQRCMKCGGKMKHSYEFVYNFFKEQNCELLNKEYINNKDLLDYICSCGNESKIAFSNFQNGHRCSACVNSKGETRIKEICKFYNVPHDSQYTFSDLRGIHNGLLKFDVSIFWDEEKTKLRMLIEYDGIFHYEKQFEEDGFERLQIHDKRKDEYCLKNNIILLRIPYWDFNNIEQILNQHLNLLKAVV